MRPRDLTEDGDRRPRDRDALLGKPTEDGLHRRVIPQSRIAADVEPDGITRQPRLRKHDERRSPGGCLARQLRGVRQAR
jgi:hypothetical protein